ncbi:MAG: Sec-independent protein translocase protein TatB [Dongiaceae bacterium]
MLDIGWVEFVLIAVIALLVLKPEDLPKVMRIAGQWARKIRGLMKDVQRQIDQAVQADEVKKIREELDASGLRDQIDPNQLIDPRDKKPPEGRA